MIKTHFKQAWNIIKQNKLFSSIYVAGTALSIALTMTIFVIYYVKIAPIYPEYNRGRTLCLKYQQSVVYQTDSTGREKIVRVHTNGTNYSFINGILSKIDDVEASAARVMLRQNITTQDKQFIKDVPVSAVNTDFWKVFTFEFLDGTPFSDADMVKNPKSIIISSDFAKKLFGNTNVAGEWVKLGIDENEFQIIGVVKGTSALTLNSYSDIYVPITKYVNTDLPFTINNALGNCEIYFTVKNNKQKQVIGEIEEYINKANTVAKSEAKHGGTNNNRWNELKVEGAVKPYWKSEIVNGSIDKPIWDIMKEILLLIASVLIVPAINLSSMISSRMDERRAEMGIRLAFGATKGTIIKQVLWENLQLTCIGGAFGLLLTYILVSASTEWIFTLFDSRGSVNFLFDTSLNVDMLFNPYIFMATFIICLIINIVSAILPARWSLSDTIVEQLNTKN